MSFKDIPAWFWMIMIALIAVPMSYSIFKNGIKAKLSSKIVSAELDAENDPVKEEIKPIESESGVKHD